MEHLKRIAAGLAERGLDALLITSEPGEYYAVGFHGEGVALILPEASYYYTDSRYFEAARQQIQAAQVLQCRSGENYRTAIHALAERHGLSAIGFEEETMTVAAHGRWQQALGSRLSPASALLRELRMIKDQEETAAIAAAQQIAEQALEEVLGFLRPGLTEQEVSARLQYEMLCRGAEKPSFDPIVASGPNGSVPHAVPSIRKLQRGDFVTLDFGCKYSGYCSDMTRTVAIGTATEEMRRVYSLVLEAQLAGIAAARGGATGKEVDGAARQIIDGAGYGSFFGHSFGHSLGLEIHESPNVSALNTTPLPVGAVVTAEPGIYLPGRFGVRIEDMLMLTDSGCVNLTKAPKELIIL